jgi:acetyl-CoA carboxylase biotin carboxyl carrier protein
MKPDRKPRAVDADAAVELARKLAAILKDLDLTEVEASVGEIRVRLQRATPAIVPLASPAVPSSLGVPSAAGTATLTAVDVAGTTLVTVEAPMVGTFYRASAPTAEPYVKEGDIVKEGQILCIIEAMKLMNEIEARTGGRIAKILVENSQPVEYGQPLFLLEPSR